MLEQIKGYDWKEAFAFCGDPGLSGDDEGGWAACNGPEKPERVPGQQDKVSNAPCLREDVVAVIAIDEGANDEANWIGLFKMKDGRYLSLSAGCDYTGWD